MVFLGYSLDILWNISWIFKINPRTNPGLFQHIPRISQGNEYSRVTPRNMFGIFPNMCGNLFGISQKYACSIPNIFPTIFLRYYQEYSWHVQKCPGDIPISLNTRVMFNNIFLGYSKNIARIFINVA